MYAPLSLTHRTAQSLLIAGVCAMLTLAASLVSACPFCSAPSLTLSEQLAQSDAAVLVQWKSGKMGDREQGDIGSTTYQIVDVVRNTSKELKKGQDVTLPRYRAGSEGELFLLLGTQGTSIEWSSPLEITETSFNYLRQAPSPEAPTSERLAYFVRFLEFPDPLISNDAYAEFANAPYSDIVTITDKLSPEQLRKWVSDKETVPTRLGLYGLLLGLCGTEEDAALMKRQILTPSEEFRLGIDGVMAGYLLIAGDNGLDVIDAEKLKNKDIPFSETYAAMQALRFMWTDGQGRIDHERLRESMRILLDRPELADLVIADLAPGRTGRSWIDSCSCMGPRSMASRRSSGRLCVTCWSPPRARGTMPPLPRRSKRPRSISPRCAERSQDR